MYKSLSSKSVAVLLSLVCSNLLQASEFGRNGFSGNPFTNSGADCTVCHAPGAAKPIVALSGPTLVNAGLTYNYTVTVQGGPGVTAGVDISTTGLIGTLAPMNTDLRRLGRELTHAKPKAMAANLASFNFNWTAPTYNKDITLYAAGNSTNGQRNLLGDGIGKATLLVKVQNGTAPPPPPPPPPPTPITLDEHVRGLDRPVAISHAKDSRLFIVERPGRIRIAKGKGNLLATPFLDITSRVLSVGSEQGLLGLAFHPNYATNGFFYVYYTRDVVGAANDRSRISRFRRSSGNPDQADPTSEVVLMEFNQPFANHNGGDLHFGPDGYLYIASGDGGSGGDPKNYAQRYGNLLGKLLRIDVNGLPGSTNGPDCGISLLRNYRIPPSNAFTDGKLGQGCDEIYALGLRNPWRFSFDRLNGNLWIADVGQTQIEEIDFIPAKASGGLNLGWRCYEGNQTYNTLGCNRTYLFPVYTYPHDASGNCSVTGGYVYRGAAFPKLAGKYFFTDFCNSAIRTLAGPLSSPTVVNVLPKGQVVSPSTFGEDSSGELYVANLSQGIVFRIVGSP